MRDRRRSAVAAMRRIPGTVPAAALVATLTGGPAFAQSCDRACNQAADQEALLSQFNSLLFSSAGRAVLDANLQKENEIYLNSTQADKIASGTILIISKVPENVLLRAFPGNPNFTYDAQGLPSAPQLPTSIKTMVADIISNNQIVPMKSYFGTVDTYGTAYGYLPGQSDSVGNPPPYQVSAAILNNPFTVANSSLLAWQNQQTPGTWGINWQLGNSQVGDFPSAHTMMATSTAIPFAILAPGYYQQLAYSVVNFSYDLNVYAVHYPVDVIGGRIMATYVIAKMLAADSANPLYESAIFNVTNLPTLSRDLQTYFANAGIADAASSPYAAACTASLATCLRNGTIPTAATYTQLAQNYIQFLTYGLPSTGPTNLAPVVPTEAQYLIATRFPYLSVAQLNEVLATTELPSGVLFDDGSGWARLNLYAAAGGYGAFRSNVTVNMDASRGGLNAFDVWSNNISGPGGLTLQGTGTLVLAGNNTYTGGTTVQGGTLAVTGSLLGPLSIWSGATFAVGSTGTFTGTIANDGTFNNYGTVIGSFSGSGAFANAGFLGGDGTFGSLDLLSGSIIAPGHSVGTIQVTGALTVAPGATYQVQVEGNTADRIQVGGTATLGTAPTVPGGNVVASLIGYSPVLGYAYPILTATGGVSGQFESATTSNLPFLQAGLTYDTNDAYLTLTRNGVRFASVATSTNQVAVANALDLGPSGSGLGLALATQSAGGAQQAFNALSGEIHATAQTVMLSDSLYVREALLGRMRQGSFAGGGGPLAAFASGGPTLAYADESRPSLPQFSASALAHAGEGQPAVPFKARPGTLPETVFWTQGVGAWGKFNGSTNAADASRTLGGFFSGVDRRFGPDWLAGFAAGYTNSSIGVGARSSSATADTAHLAGYVAGLYGPWTLRGAAAASFSTLDTTRTILFPGFTDSATAHYGATVVQAFGEVGHGIAIGRIAAEPFAGLAFVHLSTGDFTEAGGTGTAALGGSASNEIGYTTLGARTSTQCILPGGMVLTPRLSAVWQHALGPVTPTAALAFQSTGASFALTGVPLARDQALLESGVDLQLSERVRVGLTYATQLGGPVRQDSVKGSLAWRF